MGLILIIMAIQLLHKSIKKKLDKIFSSNTKLSYNKSSYTKYFLKKPLYQIDCRILSSNRDLEEFGIATARVFGGTSLKKIGVSNSIREG